MNNTKMSFGARVKEFFRKVIVSLKHRPRTIPLLMLVITFVYFSLNLTSISDTTAKINRMPMGLCQFIIFLFSMLGLVCFMNAFPNRKPVNKIMLTLAMLMVAVVFAADVIYGNIIENAIVRDQVIIVTQDKAYIYKAWVTLRVHEIMLGISVALTALLPVYSKLLRKIDTNIEVEAGGEMAAIDVSGED